MRALFHRDGFVLVEGLFDAAACDRLQALLRRHADADFGAILNPDRDDFLERQSPPEARAHVAETAAALRAAMREPRMVALLDSLWERPVVGLGEGPGGKPGGQRPRMVLHAARALRQLGRVERLADGAMPE
ncbi:MAG: phytanoyl-CoA dioxygenase family protein, partial [Alphaproteobacteria bacterium]|nr:phytanoyl-CoA dioxygenase family protein [Alphaproteobacteria bacterium]